VSEAVVAVQFDELPEEEATVLEAEVAFTSLAVRFDEIVLPVLRFLRPYVCTGTMSLGLGMAKLSWPLSPAVAFAVDGDTVVAAAALAAVTNDVPAAMVNSCCCCC
jgi:hypothetical protein